MKALRIVEKGRTDIVDIPEPSPGPAEVLLKVAVVGLCGTDLNSFRGRNPLVSYPRIPGHELSAIVLDKGPGVAATFKPGAPVFVIPYNPCGLCSACRKGRFNTCRDNKTLGVQCDGGATERIVVKAEKLLTHDRLTLGDMALVEPLTVGSHAVDRGRIAAGETVAIFGCGVVGLGAMAGSARRGARVIAIDVDDRKLEVARRAGASHAINTARTDLHTALQELTGGDGPDVVIEAVGATDTFRAAVDEVAFAGRIVFIGYTAEDVACHTKYFVQKELDIMGSRNATRPDFETVAAMLADGSFPREAVVSRVVSLDEAGPALSDWSADPARVTKIHVDVGGVL